MTLTPDELAALNAGYAMPEGDDLIKQGDDAIRANAVRSHKAAWKRGPLTAHVDTLTGESDQGKYDVESGAVAQQYGIPSSSGGSFIVLWVRGTTNATTTHLFVSEFLTILIRRRNSTSGWQEWERADVAGAVEAGVALGVRDLAAGADVNDLVLREHVGPWRVPTANVAGEILNLPVPHAGILDVGYVRGGASAGVALHEYVTEFGVTYRRRRNSSSGWLEWEEAREGTTVVVGALPVTHVDVILTAGQSNMVGFATPFGPDYGDTPDGRIWMCGAKGRELTPATVPLDNHGGEGAAGISMATFFAREWTRNNPVDSIALLVPAAHGGNGFDPSAEWNWRDASGPSSLREAMMDQLTDAVAAAEAQWPDAEVRVRAMLWHQGENSTAIADEADYVAAFGDVIGDVRALWPDTPVILGELSPDRAGGVSGTVTGRAHQIIPAEIPGTALAHTRPNGSREGDTSHLGREGAEQVGRAMFEAYPAAIANRDGLLVMPPHNVWAWRDGGRVMVEWSAPLCRAIDYQLQTWDGSAWASPAGLTITGRRAEITGASSLTHVRVATVGPDATSRWTAGNPIRS